MSKFSRFATSGPGAWSKAMHKLQQHAAGILWVFRFRSGKNVVRGSRLRFLHPCRMPCRFRFAFGRRFRNPPEPHLGLMSRVGKDGWWRR